MPGPLAQMLERKSPLLLDGAMGTELQRLGVDTGLPLWSARALLECPDRVFQIHSSYIKAGADIITTDSFRTTRRTFERARLPDRSGELTAAAVSLACHARKEFPAREILVAGSMAPLEDCYRPDLVPSDAELDEEHAVLARRLAAAGVDFLLLETMGTIREAFAACVAARATGKETVVSFLCNTTANLYGGESLEDAVMQIAPLQPAAFSINCISPRYLAVALRKLISVTDLPIAVYANVGGPEQERGADFTVDTGPDAYTRFAREWLSIGASIFGGCCGTTPVYIRALQELLHPNKL